jgi:hypothetical protein
MAGAVNCLGEKNVCPGLFRLSRDAIGRPLPARTVPRALRTMRSSAVRGASRRCPQALADFGEVEAESERNLFVRELIDVFAVHRPYAML